MPWQERDDVTLRTEFLVRARQEGANIAALCRAYQISRKTAYKWLARTRADPNAALADRPRTPHASPRQTPAEVAAAVVAMRRRYPCWGARKLAVKLRAAGVRPVPAPSTITVILQRHGLLPPRQPRVPGATRRFEHPHAHDLWQMDFMGHRALASTDRVHPLTIVDDHSRVLLSLTACPDEQLETVWPLLWACLGRYGLPQAILTDNGPPWGPSVAPGITRFEAWLLRLGVEAWHGRPAHPQTQGKVERLHGTISVEAFGPRTFRDLAAAQAAFDAFRTTYNEDRPHAALDLAVPLTRLRPNPRPRPAVIPAPVYGPDDTIRLVSQKGVISFQGRRWHLSSGLAGEPVAVRSTAQEGSYQVFFCHRQIGAIDVQQSATSGTHVSEHL